MESLNVFFQIINLSKNMATVLTLVRTKACMLAEVVSNVRELKYGCVAALEQTFIISSRLNRFFILDAYNFYHTCWYATEFIF